MRKVLFLGELPPQSINGIAISNQINIEILKEIFLFTIVLETPILTKHSKITLNKFSNNLFNALTIIKYLYKNNFDYFYMVYSNSFFGAIKSLFFIYIVNTFNKKCKINIHVHRGDLQNFLNKSKINIFIFRLIEKKSNKILLLSLNDLKFLSNKFKSSKSYVLKNCINRESCFKEKRNKKIKFLYLSNYIFEKGILELLQEFSLINENIELECFGNFSDSDLKNKILTFQRDNIKIFGPISGNSKFKKIYECDCLILPSKNEGMPLVLIEAMSTGTPFISTNVGFINENIINDYPLLYNLSDTNGLSKKIKYFLNLNKNEKDILGKNLVEYYNTTFSKKSHTKDLFEIFI